MTFRRLRAVDWVAMIAAIALLFVMALDWYSTQLGDEARRIQRTEQPQGGVAGEAQREVQKDAALSAQSQEKNAWQAGDRIDRLILIMLQVTVALAVASAFLRATGRHYVPPWTPSAITAILAALTAGLVLYRIIEQPGLREVTTVKAGAPLAIVVLGVLALAAARGVKREAERDEFREVAVE